MEVRMYMGIARKKNMSDHKADRMASQSIANRGRKGNKRSWI